MASRLFEYVRETYAEHPDQKGENPFEILELADGTVVAREELPFAEGDPPRTWCRYAPWVEYLPTVIEHRFRDDGWKPGHA